MFSSVVYAHVALQNGELNLAVFSAQRRRNTASRKDSAGDREREREDRGALAVAAAVGVAGNGGYGAGDNRRATVLSGTAESYQHKADYTTLRVARGHVETFIGIILGRVQQLRLQRSGDTVDVTAHLQVEGQAGEDEDEEEEAGVAGVAASSSTSTEAEQAAAYVIGELIDRALRFRRTMQLVERSITTMLRVPRLNSELVRRLQSVSRRMFATVAEDNAFQLLVVICKMVHQDTVRSVHPSLSLSLFLSLSLSVSPRREKGAWSSRLWRGR